SHQLSYTGMRKRPWWESNPRQALLQSAALPLDHRIIQSRRWDSNPLRPRYEGGARPVEHRRHQEQPVLVSSQLDQSSEPQSPAEGLAVSRSCRSRTCQPGFVVPALESRETTQRVPHAGVEPANRPSEGQRLKPQDRASITVRVFGGS